MQATAIEFPLLATSAPIQNPQAFPGVAWILAPWSGEAKKLGVDTAVAGEEHTARTIALRQGTEPHRPTTHSGRNKPMERRVEEMNSTTTIHICTTQAQNNRLGQSIVSSTACSSKDANWPQIQGNIEDAKNQTIVSRLMSLKRTIVHTLLWSFSGDTPLAHANLVFLLDFYSWMRLRLWDEGQGWSQGVKNYLINAERQETKIPLVSFYS